MYEFHCWSKGRLYSETLVAHTCLGSQLERVVTEIGDQEWREQLVQERMEFLLNGEIQPIPCGMVSALSNGHAATTCNQLESTGRVWHGRC
jgi:hypothetical protein